MSAPQTAAVKPKVLICAVGKDLLPSLGELFSQWEIQQISTQNEFDDKMMDLTDGMYQAMLCGDLFGVPFANEFGQVLKQQCTSTPMYYVTANKGDFNRATYIKNGFTDAMLWPNDKPLLNEKIVEITAAGTNAIIFRPVFASDLMADTDLPFSTFVFLPLNKKYVPFSKKEGTISQEKLDRLKKKEYGKVYLDKKDTDNFYKYTAENLKRNMNQLSETERQEKVQSSVRGIFTHLLDQSTSGTMESGKEALVDCQKVISSYVTNGKSGNWYSQLVKSLGGAMNSYDHAATVSSIAALVAMGIGHPKPEDLALAGFFHDVGRTDFDESFLDKPEVEWPTEVREKYHKHPQLGVNVIKEKRILLPAETEKAILQHHERFDGKGFPKQLSGERICEEAQILNFADQFSYLTIDREGSQRLTPKDAFNQIKNNGTLGPMLLKKIEKLMFS